MSDGFYSDYTGAVFSGVGDTIKKSLVLLSVGASIWYAWQREAIE